MEVDEKTRADFLEAKEQLIQTRQQLSVSRRQDQQDREHLDLILQRIQMHTEQIVERQTIVQTSTSGSGVIPTLNSQKRKRIFTDARQEFAQFEAIYVAEEENDQDDGQNCSCHWIVYVLLFPLFPFFLIYWLVTKCNAHCKQQRAREKQEEELEQSALKIINHIERLLNNIDASQFEGARRDLVEARMELTQLLEVEDRTPQQIQAGQMTVRMIMKRIGVHVARMDEAEMLTQRQSDVIREIRENERPRIFEETSSALGQSQAILTTYQIPDEPCCSMLCVCAPPNKTDDVLGSTITDVHTQIRRVYENMDLHDNEEVHRELEEATSKLRQYQSVIHTGRYRTTQQQRTEQRDLQMIVQRVHVLVQNLQKDTVTREVKVDEITSARSSLDLLRDAKYALGRLQGTLLRPKLESICFSYCDDTAEHQEHERREIELETRKVNSSISQVINHVELEPKFKVDFSELQTIARQYQQWLTTPTPQGCCCISPTYVTPQLIQEERKLLLVLQRVQLHISQLLEQVLIVVTEHAAVEAERQQKREHQRIIEEQRLMETQRNVVNVHNNRRDEQKHVETQRNVVNVHNNRQDEQKHVETQRNVVNVHQRDEKNVDSQLNVVNVHNSRRDEQKHVETRIDVVNVHAVDVYNNRRAEQKFVEEYKQEDRVEERKTRQAVVVNMQEVAQRRVLIEDTASELNNLQVSLAKRGEKNKKRTSQAILTLNFQAQQVATHIERIQELERLQFAVNELQDIRTEEMRKIEESRLRLLEAKTELAQITSNIARHSSSKTSKTNSRQAHQRLQKEQKRLEVVISKVQEHTQVMHQQEIRLTEVVQVEDMQTTDVVERQRVQVQQQRQKDQDAKSERKQTEQIFHELTVSLAENKEPAGCCVFACCISSGPSREQLQQQEQLELAQMKVQNAIRRIEEGEQRRRTEEVEIYLEEQNKREQDQTTVNNETVVTEIVSTENKSLVTDTQQTTSQVVQTQIVNHSVVNNTVVNQNSHELNISEQITNDRFEVSKDNTDLQQTSSTITSVNNTISAEWCAVGNRWMTPYRGLYYT
jgi:hypothetical protein